jgi:hypothetical protein
MGVTGKGLASSGFGGEGRLGGFGGFADRIAFGGLGRFGGCGKASFGGFGGAGGLLGRALTSAKSETRSGRSETSVKSSLLVRCKRVRAASLLSLPSAMSPSSMKRLLGSSSRREAGPPSIEGALRDFTTL